MCRVAFCHLLCVDLRALCRRSVLGIFSILDQSILARKRPGGKNLRGTKLILKREALRGALLLKVHVCLPWQIMKWQVAELKASSGVN